MNWNGGKRTPREMIAADRNTVCNGNCFCCPRDILPFTRNDDDGSNRLVAPTTIGDDDMALKKRPVTKDTPDGPGATWDDLVFSRDFPSLYSFLNDVRYDDGSIRVTGTLSVFTKLGVLTCAINDNDRNVVGFINAPTWDDLWMLIEDGILNDSIDWKARRPQTSGGKPPF